MLGSRPDNASRAKPGLSARAGRSPASAWSGAAPDPNPQPPEIPEGMCSVTAVRLAVRPAVRTDYSKLLVRRLCIDIDDGLKVGTSLTQRGEPTTPNNGTGQRFRWSVWVWSPPPESNRRHHPYHGSGGTPPCYPRSPQVASHRECAVMGSVAEWCPRRPPGQERAQCQQTTVFQARLDRATASWWSHG